jgi:hypothetical protein
MAKSRKVRNVPVKTSNKVSVRKIFSKISTEQLTIKSYDLSTIDNLQPIQSFDNIAELSAAAMVAVALLCQLRSLRPDGNASKLDQLPSFRFYKKKISLGSSGQALAMALAVSVEDAIVLMPDNPDELEGFMISLLECYSGNEKFIEKVSSNNLSEFLTGHMSRILGIINSCPSANMGVFNIDSSVSTWGISDVLSRLPGNYLKNVTVDAIIDIFTRECDVPNSAIIFSEAPFVGSLSIEDGCKLEKEIFGNFMPKRNSPSNSIKTSSSSSSILSEAVAKARLTSLEYRKYKAALNINLKDVINRYESLVQKRILADSSTPSNPVT